MRVSYLTLLMSMILVASGFSVSLQNGNISVEVNGDGSIGALEYRGLNNVNDSSLRLRHSSNMFEMQHVRNSEKVYDNFQMMTGYGRQQNSNMYVITTTRIYGTNTCVDQTMVILSRLDTDLGISSYLDADVKQTMANDYATYNGANHTIVQSEDDYFVGFKATRNSNFQNTYMADDILAVQTELPRSNLPNTIISNSPIDMAAAMAWDNLDTGDADVVVKTKLMAGNSDTEIQNLGNTSLPPVYVLGKSNMQVKKAKFKQKFTDIGKDSLRIKGEIDIRDYAIELENLSGLDLSVYIGDYIVFQAGDGSEKKVKNNKRTHEIKSFKGKHIISLKSHKGILKYSLKISKTDIRSATLVSANSPIGTQQPILLPFSMILTGTNPNDKIKAGKVWIVADSIGLKADKKNDKKATGKN